MPTALHRNSKADTVLLLLSAVDDMFVDLSQYRTNISDGTTYFYETPSSRTRISGNRETIVVCQIGTGTTGTLLLHGDEDVSTYRIRIASGSVIVTEGGTDVVTVACPELVGAAATYIVHWSTALVAAGSVRSELLVVRVASGAAALAFATHAPATLVSGTGLLVGTSFATKGNPADDYSEGAEGLSCVRIGTRFHSTTEAWEDWKTESSAPSIASETRLEPTPIDTTTGVDDEGSVDGPAILHSAYATTQADKRLWSPIVSEVYRQSAAMPLLASTFLPARHSILAPGSDYLHLLLRHLWQRPVPPGCVRAHCRVHVTAFPTGGTEVVSQQFQIWAANRNPWAGAGPPVKWTHTEIETRAVNDGTVTGTGAWVDLGGLSLPVYNGFCWFALGVGFGEGGDGAGVTRLRVNAVQIEPTYPIPFAGADDFTG